MYTCNCHFFFFGHTSSCSHLRAKPRIGWAQSDRWGHVAGGLGAIRAVCRAWQAFETFSALGTDKANPRVSATSPGMVFPHPPGDCVSTSLRRLGLRIPPEIGFPHPLSPCTHVRFGCKPTFSAKGYTYISLFFRALSWASIYWQYIAPGSTSILAVHLSWLKEVPGFQDIGHLRTSH